MPRLTKRQFAFVTRYLANMNASDAAEHAGYARTAGSALLKNPSIAAEIDREIERRREVHRYAVDRTMAEIEMIAFGDVKTFVDFGPDGVVLRDARDVPYGATRVLSEVSSTETKTGGVNVKVKMHDKLAALKLYGEYFDVWGNRALQRQIEAVADKLNTVLAKHLGAEQIDEIVRELAREGASE